MERGPGGGGYVASKVVLEGCAKSRPGRTDPTLGVPEPVQGLRGSREGPGKVSEAHFGSLFEASGLQLAAFVALPGVTWSRFGNLDAFEALQNWFREHRPCGLEEILESRLPRSAPRKVSRATFVRGQLISDGRTQLLKAKGRIQCFSHAI